LILRDVLYQETTRDANRLEGVPGTHTHPGKGSGYTVEKAQLQFARTRAFGRTRGYADPVE